MNEPVTDPISLRSVLGDDVPDVLITGINVASGDVQPGDVFVALPGHKRHGATFATDAIANGAQAIITDEQGLKVLPDVQVPVIVREELRAQVGLWAATIYRTTEHALRLIGVTGTNGKSTVAHLIALGCQDAGLRAGVIGTLGITFGDRTISLTRTTPEAPVLHRWLATFEREQIDIAIIEVSSHAMSEFRIGGVMFEVAAFTNLSQDHLDYHGDMERYFAAKAGLFISTYAEHAVIGIDDEWGRRLSAQVAIPQTTWSMVRGDVTGFVTPGGVGIRDRSGVETQMSLALPGTFNAANATCAAAVMEKLGVNLATHSQAFSQARIPGRMEEFRSSDGVSVIVDYAHTPDAIEHVLESVMDSGPVIVVLGAGGDRDQGKRRGMGVAAGERAAMVIITDDNPRSEDPASIRAEIIAGAQGTSAQVLEIADRRAAIARALAEAKPGDSVLVLGKGHEGGQEVAGVITPFDDRQIVQELLEGRDVT